MIITDGRVAIMRAPWYFLALVGMACAQAPIPQLPSRDAVRIREFYRLTPRIAEAVWPKWGETLAPLLLVTNENEFLTHYPNPPAAFKKIGDDIYVRPRQYPLSFLATFPALGSARSVIVIGEAENTSAKTSTPWIITLMHEHFHQLQDGQPGLLEAVKGLGLAHGDETGMWMLNYPFPYDKPELNRSFLELRDSLLAALNEPDNGRFRPLARRYVTARKQFFAQLSEDDAKYLSFQLWKEGIARYVQVKSAEAAAAYEAAPEYTALSDYESFMNYAARARADTLDELKQADLAKWQRVVVYSFGAGEGFLLDRLNPGWRESYFRHLFTLDPYFDK